MYDNEEGGSGTSTSSGLGGPKTDDIDDIIDFLGDDKDDKIDLTESVDSKKVKKDKDKDTDEEADVTDKTDEDEDEDKEDIDDELEDLVDEDKEPDEEKLELVVPVRRKEILKKYPELFKDFPYLEKAYYREQQYTELLPTIQDAKSAVEKSQTLDRFETDLVKGSVETIFKAVKAEQPNSFAKIVDDLLPAINRVDPQAFNHILANVSKHTIAAMAIEAKKSNNDQLRMAAQILNQFIFGSSDYKAPTRLSHEEKPDSKVDELNRREQEFIKRQFDTSKSDLDTRVNNTLRNTIESHIDPRDSMTDYVKRNAVREVSENLSRLIKQDQRFTTILDKLWEKAFNKNFSSDTLDTIRSAYLSKAKTLLPSVIKKARIDALRGMGKRVSDTTINDDERKTERSNIRQQDKPRPTSKSGKTVPDGMSTLEFLNQD